MWAVHRLQQRPRRSGCMAKREGIPGPDAKCAVDPLGMLGWMASRASVSHEAREDSPDPAGEAGASGVRTLCLTSPQCRSRLSRPAIPWGKRHGP